MEALITVKREEDGIEESGGPAGSSRLPETTVVKHRNNESQNMEHSKRRLINKRGAVLVSDNEENEVGSEEECRGIDGSTYKFRKTSRINYREEDDDDEEDELMMGAEVISYSLLPTRI